MIDQISVLGSAVSDTLALTLKNSQSAHRPQPASFIEMLTSGVEVTNDKVAAADRLVREFVLDSSVPVHQVAFALEEARLSLDMLVQVRNRLVEGYQQIMNMQV